MESFPKEREGQTKSLQIHKLSGTQYTWLKTSQWESQWTVRRAGFRKVSDISVRTENTCESFFQYFKIIQSSNGKIKTTIKYIQRKKAIWGVWTGRSSLLHQGEPWSAWLPPSHCVSSLSHCHLLCTFFQPTNTSTTAESFNQVPASLGFSAHCTKARRWK